MPDPTWTILIPTLGQREHLFKRLLDGLLPQLDAYDGRARVLAWWNNGRPSLPHIRHALLAAAGTDYVSFVDDDDLVADDYVSEILRALATWPDKVGFRTQYYEEGEPRDLVEHSIRHGRWYRDRAGLYRDLTHIDPLRTDLARRGDFRKARAGRAEDRVWVKQVRPHVRTEVYIPKVMYHYLWSREVSAWQRPDRIQQVGQRPTVDHPHFAWHSGSLDA